MENDNFKNPKLHMSILGPQDQNVVKAGEEVRGMMHSHKKDIKMRISEGCGQAFKIPVVFKIAKWSYKHFIFLISITLCFTY